jgi:hypothetical protein
MNCNGAPVPDVLRAGSPPKRLVSLVPGVFDRQADILQHVLVKGGQFAKRLALTPLFDPAPK